MIEVDLPEGLYRQGPRDWKYIADLTAVAFAEDPVAGWVFGAPRAIQSAFRLLAREVYTRRGFCYTVGGEGAAMWIGPEQAGDLSTLAQVQLAIGLHRFGTAGALKRAMAASEAMAAHHPAEPHMYLFTIGVLPSGRGRGHGHALLRPMLEACDRSRTPAYLENSNPKNHGFYAAHGFERREIFHPGDGAPPLEAMWRPPKAG